MIEKTKSETQGNIPRPQYKLLLLEIVSTTEPLWLGKSWGDVALAEAYGCLSMVSDRDLIAAPYQPVVLEADHLTLVRLEGCFLEFGLFNKTSKSQEQLSVAFEIPSFGMAGLKDTIPLNVDGTVRPSNTHSKVDSLLEERCHGLETLIAQLQTIHKTRMLHRGPLRTAPCQGMGYRTPLPALSTNLVQQHL